MLTEQDMDEIIAIEFGEHIYLGQLAIDKAIELKTVNKVYSRWVFQFMADMDLDSRWAQLACAPTLFKMSWYEQYARGEPIDKIFSKSQQSCDDSNSQR